jgi:secondary thiamine-phosphate synthase enzyme
MKSYTEYLTFNTKKRRDLIRITDTVKEAVRKSGVKEGLCLVSAMHLTAAVIIQDDEEGLHEDIWEWLEKLAPFRPDYKHHRTGEDNGDAHLKNLLVHLQVILPITDGELDLGPWQEIFYAEFDGQRPKRVIIEIIGEQMKEAVLITYMGAPSNLKEIKPFLYRLFSDRDLINFGVPEILQKPLAYFCLLYTSPSPRDRQKSRMPSSA